ncbi:MAG: Hsp20/alpha crystallin family protein [Cyanobacteria bacterium Co-bin8]|nr:Hsp20/alpha crystallin family protein [Cyanobacteria bacterium Co-bin8]
MMVRYWQPFREIDALRRQVDDVFSELTDMSTAVRSTWAPAVRLVDTGDNYALHIQLAGVSAEDLDIQATREAVVITGERKVAEAAEGHKVLFDDLRYGNFRRVITLPEAIQNDHIQADFSNGLLTLTLPKVVEARNKVVKINLGELKGADAPAIAPAEAATATDADHAETSDVWATNQG